MNIKKTRFYEASNCYKCFPKSTPFGQRVVTIIHCSTPQNIVCDSIDRGPRENGGVNEGGVDGTGLNNRIMDDCSAE